MRRASISTMLEELVSRDILEVGRGTIRVSNRAKLEKAACECYLVIRRAYADLVAATDGKSLAG